MNQPSFLARFAEWTLLHKRIARPLFVLAFCAAASAFVLYTVKIGARMLRTGSLLPCASGGCESCGSARPPVKFPEIPKAPSSPKKP